MIVWRNDDAPVNPEIFKTSEKPVPESSQITEDFPRQIQLYSLPDLFKFEKQARLAKDADELTASKKLLDELRHRGKMRDLMTMRPTFRTDLDQLKQRFPNFSAVIDYIRGCAEIAWRTDKVLRFTPILLNGPGGVGKTMFSEALVAWMNQGFHRISISSSQNGSELAGSSSFFSNAKPGVPFTSLLYSEFANPVLFLDEIDKNSTHSYDALGALYVLLEPSTARTYKDQCYELPIDASHILYIGACNDSTLLPDPLRTRFKEFDITITREQSRAIAASIVRSTLASIAPATDGMTISAEALEILAEMTPRRIGQAVTEAIGTAFANNSTVIDQVARAESQQRRIGFLS